MGFTDEQRAALQRSLDPSLVKGRQGPGGQLLSYIDAKTAIDHANSIFGHDGWSHVVESLAFVDDLVYAIVSVTAGGVTHTDVGVGTGTGPSREKAIKEAASDGLKRALRCFGNPFGLELYDKESELHAAAAANTGGVAQSATRGPSNRRPAPTLPASGAGANLASWPRDVADDAVPDNPVCEVSGEPFTGYTSSSGKVYTPRLEAAWALHQHGRIVKRKYANQ